jgi:hypothetical protein
MLDVGRQGAEVRVRLYLWLFACLSTRNFANVDLRRTTGEWAMLINVMREGEFTDQRKRTVAARRVARATDYLVAQKLAARVRPGTVRLLDPDGCGQPYRPWDAATVSARAKERADIERGFSYQRLDYRRSRVWEDRPLRLPAKLWTNGAVSALTAPALTVLLVLWDYHQDKGPGFEVPKSRAYEYPISHATWQKGTDQLRAAGIASAVPGAAIFGSVACTGSMRRHRLSWTLHPAVLGL